MKIVSLNSALATAVQAAHWLRSSFAGRGAANVAAAARISLGAAAALDLTITAGFAGGLAARAARLRSRRAALLDVAAELADLAEALEPPGES